MADVLEEPILGPRVQEVFATDETEAHRDWVRRAVEAPFYFPGLLPNVMPANVRQATASGQRSLFELCGDPADIQPHVVRSALPKTDEPTVDDEMSLPERLRIAGIKNTHRGLRDDHSPPMPRSLGYPVKLEIAENSYQLILSTPACADLDFVRRVEMITGLQARWVPVHCKGGSSAGQWHHAVDLATDEGWERLAASMDHTTRKQVSKAVGFGVKYGYLTAFNGRQLLSTVGIAEPGARLCSKIVPDRNGRLPLLFDGWEAVHAVEDGLIIPGNPKKKTFARATDAGWQSIGKEPPAFMVALSKSTRSVTPCRPLTAMFDDAGLGRRPTPKDLALVEAAIHADLPANAPTYAKHIISVRQHEGKTVARIRLFDDEIVALTVTEKPSAQICGWDAHPYDDRIFGYCYERQAWARISVASSS